MIRKIPDQEADQPNGHCIVPAQQKVSVSTIIDSVRPRGLREHTMEVESSFTLHLEQVSGYEFRVRFDSPVLTDLIVDEPPPLGQQHGPNASRLLAAAVANCLSASLLFCASKAKVTPTSIRSTAHTQLVRNDRGRLRIGAVQVEIDVTGVSEEDRRFMRCTELFEDFCVVTDSIRRGIPVAVSLTANGQPLAPPVSEEP
jgi:organic hydroperoxide reductase OsmC/OhrA